MSDSSSSKNRAQAGSFKSVPSQGINDGRKPYVPAKHDAGNHASSGISARPVHKLENLESTKKEAKANALPAGQGYTTPSAHASSSKPQKQVNLGKGGSKYF
ncbi:uncharacterized protein LOC124705367 isoform X1 [Lolium rigidum]|uniref:uncharacterized protein LOC124705367 isoform X1 n=1 Tax=Lolium rigidum TaxID=89674 RepID=UPI001F5DD130|nr:uncharacterized protein LOC124705367 isoform X1 [Lolium rigidum]